jgi:hypothetical protein
MDRGGAAGRCWRVVGAYVTISPRENSPKNFLTIQALRWRVADFPVASRLSLLALPRGIEPLFQP